MDLRAKHIAFLSYDMAKYEIIFPTKTFVSTSLKVEELDKVIILKNNMPKFILLDKGRKLGRIYWGNSKQLDFRIVRKK